MLFHVLPVSKFTGPFCCPQEEDLVPSDRVRITVEDYLIKLRVNNVRRADHGDYTLTATNRNGTDTATVSVTVVGE